MRLIQINGTKGSEYYGIQSINSYHASDYKSLREINS